MFFYNYIFQKAPQRTELFSNPPNIFSLILKIFFSTEKKSQKPTCSACCLSNLTSININIRAKNHKKPSFRKLYFLSKRENNITHCLSE